MLLDPTFPDPSFSPDLSNFKPTYPEWGSLDQAINQPYTAMDAPVPVTLPMPASAQAETSSSMLPSLSDLWAKFELVITPESEGERLVNQIYGVDQNGVPLTPPNVPVPDYNPGDLAMPATVIKAKKAVVNTITMAGDAVKDTVIKYGIIAVALGIALIFVYAFAGSYGRELAAR